MPPECLVAYLRWLCVFPLNATTSEIYIPFDLYDSHIYLTSLRPKHSTQHGIYKMFQETQTYKHIQENKPNKEIQQKAIVYNLNIQT